jgi:putative lipoprotein
MPRSGTAALPGLAALALLLGGCAAGTEPAAKAAGMNAQVTGTVTYRERIALPPTAELTVKLADVSRADAPDELIGQQVIRAEGRQVPFAFAIDYDAARIVPAHTYAVQVRIEDRGRLLFISDQVHPVLTRGAPASVDVVVRRVP